MFGKRSADAASETALKDDAPVVHETEPSQSKKDRPTPSRKEAEAARKAALTGKAKPGANKKEARAAARAQAQQDRIKAREGMARGDARYLPARDQGPVRKFVRDYIDSRRTVAEFFVPVAVVVLILGLMRNVQLQAFVTLLWMLIIVVVATDTIIMMFRMNRKLSVQFPDKADRKGVNLYGAMRALQIRRLRLPPPMFKPGGKPVVPKQK